MENKLHIEIVTPAKKYYEGDAYMVIVPALSGKMGFLPGHQPVVAQLGEGLVAASSSTDSSASDAKKFNIKGGYAQIKDDSVVVLAEHVEEV